MRGAPTDEIIDMCVAACNTLRRHDACHRPATVGDQHLLASRHVVEVLAKRYLEAGDLNDLHGLTMRTFLVTRLRVPDCRSSTPPPAAPARRGGVAGR